MEELINAKVYRTDRHIVITGIPEEEDEEAEESIHNCDAMGCSSLEHVLYRFEIPVSKVNKEDQGIKKLRALLIERDYDLEIEREPTYSPPFIWTFAIKDEKRIPLCSTQSYYVRQGIEHLPGWLDRALEQ